MSQPPGGYSAPDSPPLAFCYRHPSRPTAIRCTRCDRPICPECMREAPVGFQCPDDVKLGRVTQRTSIGVRLRSGFPVWTASIIVVNVLVYLATVVGSSGGIDDPTFSRLFSDWQMFPGGVALSDEYYRLITSAFLHVSLIHILLNMWALWVIGPFLERLLGPARYLSLYLLCALGGSVAVYLFGSTYGGVAGASGAIFGLFAASLVFVRELGLNVQWLATTIAINFVFTFAVADISKLGHVGGFVTGAVASVAIGGIPTHSRVRPTATVQVAGLVGVFVALLIAVAWRSATFPTL